jgi:hypothetical protein
MLSPETPRMLVVRHPTYRHDFYQVIDNWIRHFGGPHAGLLDVRDLPLDLNPQQQGGQPYGAMVPWLQDPVQHWSPECYAQTLALQQQCDARQIPVLNRVERLAHAGKARGAELMQSVGLRVPRMALITDPQEFRETLLGVPLPLFVREDWGHRGPVFEIRTMAQAQQIPFEQLQRPVAIEWINTAGFDGLYRKHRYFAAGDIGISHHLQCSTEWLTRGDNRVITPSTRVLELDYVARADRDHALFQRARRALGLDMVAFDYGRLPDGSPVVWEANPFPFIQFSTGSLKYRNNALHRSIAAVFRLYLHTLGIPIPQRLEEFISYRADTL